MTAVAAREPKEQTIAGISSEVILQPVHEKSFEQLRTLNRACLPVQYSDSLYKSICSQSRTNRYAHLAWIRGCLVGNIVCRLHSVASDTDVLPNTYSGPSRSARLYIMTLSVLAPYRRLGVGSKLLKKVIEEAKKDERLAEITLHVHTINTDAIAFYEKHEFSRGEVLDGYYPRPCAFSVYRKNSGSQQGWSLRARIV